jgi:hypothetical protein
MYVWAYVHDVVVSWVVVGERKRKTQRQNLEHTGSFTDRYVRNPNLRRANHHVASSPPQKLSLEAVGSALQ